MNNTELMNDARTIFPGGVNSPVRSFSSVGGQPFSPHMPKVLSYMM